MADKITATSMTIDGSKINFLPQSVVFTPGFEVRKRITAYYGGNPVTIGALDTENRKSKLDVDIVSTQNDLDVLKTFSAYGTHTIVMVYDNGRKDTFNNASITEDISVKTGTDGVISLKIESDILITTT